MKRIAHESAFVLHHYDWSESSLILELFTRSEGRVALVAKGVKRPSSQFRPVLMPLQKLSIAYSRGKTDEAEVGTLKAAEWQGGQTMPVGAALISGYYVNELVMKLLARDDPHTALFDAYEQMIAWLHEPEKIQSGMRAFELILLKEIGLLPALDSLSHASRALNSTQLYRLGSDGLQSGDSAQTSQALSATVWQQLQEAINENASSLRIHHLQKTIAALDSMQQESLKNQLRHLLSEHTGGRTLRTRQLILELRDLQTA